MRHRSVRFRIILWNVALLTLLFVVCGTLVYKSLKWHLYSNLDSLLASRAVGVTESIETYWTMEKQAAAEHGVPTTAFSKIDNINFSKIARHWVETETGTPDLLNIVVQIFDYKGRLLVSSAHFSRWLPAEVFSLETLSEKKGRFRNIRINIDGHKSINARLFTIPVREFDRTAYILRLITPLSEVDAHLLQLRVILFCVLPLIVLLTGVVGAFLARVLLDPVARMTSAINRITSKNLHDPIDVPGTRDEIQRLAETFNSMLDRINRDFLSQQRFIQDMSHEIKTPLTIMRGSMEVALKKARSPERYGQLLQDSLEQIDRLTNIVEKLLVLARFDNHEVALQIERFDLNDLAERVFAEIRVLAEAKQIVMACVGTGSLEIEADEFQISTLLLDLLDNAIKYTRPGGHITIVLSKSGASALIEIKDTGIGISPEDLPHVFERFYRAESPGAKEKGFGLGLSLVKSIVETHQGTVSVTSRLQEGTTFTVTLPLEINKNGDL